MTFSNPLLPMGQDPYVVFKDGWYYYCHAALPLGWSPIFITKSRTITGLRTAGPVVVWEPPRFGNASADIWAPELHYIQGKWYIYFAAWSGVQGDPHQMYVLEGLSQDPQQLFSMKAQIKTKAPWGIDGTVFEEKGHLYYAWSAKERVSVNDTQVLYIAKMKNPWTLTGDEICISVPMFTWEMTEPHPVNEGPQILKRNGKVIIIYSAGSTTTDDYCLGMLVNESNNILNPHAWQKYKEPVLCKTDSVLAPGHASFTTSPDGVEDWIIFHAAKYSGSGLDRKVHAQRFFWIDDVPYFGLPVAPHQEILLPSGEYAYLLNDLAPKLQKPHKKSVN